MASRTDLSMYGNVVGELKREPMPSPMRGLRLCVIVSAIILGAIACTSTPQDKTSPQEAARSDAEEPSLSPEAARIEAARARMTKLREEAAWDGHITRREAVALAVGGRKTKMEDIEAELGRYEGRRVWHVTLFEPLGCHYNYTIDSTTGDFGDTAGGGCY